MNREGKGSGFLRGEAFLEGCTTLWLPFMLDAAALFILLIFTSFWLLSGVLEVVFSPFYCYKSIGICFIVFSPSGCFSLSIDDSTAFLIS